VTVSPSPVIWLQLGKNPLRRLTRFKRLNRSRGFVRDIPGEHSPGDTSTLVGDRHRRSLSPTFRLEFLSLGAGVPTESGAASNLLDLRGPPDGEVAAASPLSFLAALSRARARRAPDDRQDLEPRTYLLMVTPERWWV
jgi:hypothetical protein